MVRNAETVQSTLPFLQHVEKEMLRAIIKICDEHSLTYYASGGTFLGAVRHQGPIPWDDDIDIAMPRPDYERLLAILPEELPQPYFFENYRTTIGYNYLLTQIRDPRVQLYMDARINRSKQPVWIDIFPLDGVPAPGRARRRWKLRLQFMELMWGLARIDESAAEAVGRSGVKQLVMRVGRALRVNKLLNSRNWTQRRDRAIQAYPFDPNGLCINAVGAYKFKSIFDVQQVYGEGASYPYQDLHLNAPENYDVYLKQIYGDYMAFPPETSRTQHGVRLLTTKPYSIGYAQGTFDMFHVGHLLLLQHAKEQCDYLIVGVNADELVKEYKNKTPVITEDQRAQIVGALDVVDEVRICHSLDKIEAHRQTPFQAIFIGDDWKGNPRWEQTQEDLARLGAQVVFLKYTDGVTSTVLRTKADRRVSE